MTLSNTKEKMNSWNSSLLLNIPIIDKQHEKFFSMFDEISHINSDTIIADKAQVERLLKELSLYTIYHFKTEELLIERSGATNLKPHQEQHSIFKQKIDKFINDQSYEDKELVNELVVFLRNWFIMHINGMDITYLNDVKRYLYKD